MLPLLMETANQASPLCRLSHCPTKAASQLPVPNMCTCSLEHSPAQSIASQKCPKHTYIPLSCPNTFEICPLPSLPKVNCQNFFIPCLEVTIQEQGKELFKSARNLLVVLYTLHSLSKSFHCCKYVGKWARQGLLSFSSLANALYASSQEGDPILSQIWIKLMPKITSIPILQLSAFKLLPIIVLYP